VKRTSFLATAPLASLLTAGSDVPGGRNLVERRASFDADAFSATLGKKADIAQVYENVAIKPVVFNNVKNSLNGLQFGFGFEPQRIALAVANHGPASAYMYSDEVWSTYRIGDFFNARNKDGSRIDKNVYYPRRNPTTASSDPDDERGSLQDVGIAALQARGVMFLACHTAVEEQARALVAAGYAPPGMSAEDAAADILAKLIPGAIIVPSMVAAIAVLQQRFRYTYITIQS
jgi:intracellular sulfur oxidation DsrE/DsrF family protein